MRTPLLLRIASIIMFLFAAGHSLGGADSWSPGENDVLRAMRSVTFQIGGVTRTYFDFYTGFGWTLTVYLLLQAVLLWQLAGLAKSNPRAIRPLIATFLVATLASAVVSWILILPIPTIFSVVLAACLGAAFFTAGATSQEATSH